MKISNSLKMIPLYLFILSSLFTLSTTAVAGPKTKIIISDTVFQVEESMMSHLDRDTDLAQAKNDSFRVEMTYERALKEEGIHDQEVIQSKLKDFQNRFPTILRNHLNEVLAKFPHTITQEGNAEVITINQGLEFWLELVSHKNPERRAAGRVFLKRPFSEKYFGQMGKFVQSLIGEFNRVTRIVKEDILTPREWGVLTKFLEVHKYSISKYGSYYLLGRGQSFFLTNEVFIDAKKLDDPMLEDRFERVIKYLSSHGINIDVAEHQGAAAFYSPSENKIAYVMPSRGDLDSFTHEGTHARFNKFQKSISSWAHKKGYAIPYQIDGPPLGLMGFGGFMNLLNELNSWRIGTSFSNPLNDQKILKLLIESYGRQAGKAATEAFGEFWPPAKVQGRSVPELLIQEIRALNSMTTEEMLNSLNKALVSNDEIGQYNFLRLVFSRYHKKQLPQAFLTALSKLEKNGSNEKIRKSAKETINRFASQDKESGRSDLIDLEREKSYREYSSTAKDWVRSLKTEQIKVIPTLFTFSFSKVLFHASHSNLKDYDSTIEELQNRFSKIRVRSSDEERAIFEKITKQQGNTFKDKVIAHLKEVNKKGFQVLWENFLEKPDYDLQEILVEHHSKKFKVEHIKKLFSVILDRSQSEKAQGSSLDLLQKIFEKLNFNTIYESFEYSSMKKSQENLNRINGLPLDTHVLTRRTSSPEHWLFSPEIDHFITGQLFDGKPRFDRLNLINFIREVTYPEEFPKLRDRVIHLVTTDNSDTNKYDLWIARMFLIPGGFFLNKSHITWGETVANAVLKDKTPSPTALEYVAEFYRLAVSKSLPGGSLLLEGTKQFNSEMKRKIQEVLTESSPRQKKLLKEAGINLWRILGHENATVRRAARYAIITHPAFLLQVQEQILHALKNKKSKYRAEAIQLISFTKPGFLTRVDRLMKSPSFSLNSRERDFLNLRLSPNEWMSQLKTKSVIGLKCTELLLAF